jgi:hypothetical protein
MSAKKLNYDHYCPVISQTAQAGLKFDYLVGPEKNFKLFSWNVIRLFFSILDCRQSLPAHSKSLQSESMKPTSSDTAQTFFLLPDLEKLLDPRSLLYRLPQAIDWKGFEKTFGSLYSTEGRPALPIRHMVGFSCSRV